MRVTINQLRLFAVVVTLSLILFPSADSSAVEPNYQRVGAIAVGAPTAVAIDGSENIYVAESSRDQVRIYNHSGTLQETITGLAKPVSVAVDSSGRIYIGNETRGNVEVFSPDRALLFKLGQGDDEFSKPNDIAIDSAGYVYVVDSEADQVKIYDSNGALRSSFGATGNTDGLFNFPTAIAVDETNQEIIVTDLQEYPPPGGVNVHGARIQVFDMSGIHLRSMGGSQKNIVNDQPVGDQVTPLGVAVDSNGFIYVADAYLNVAQLYNNAGAHIKDINDSTNSLSNPLDLAVSPLTDKLYIVSLTASRVDIYGLNTSNHTVTITSPANGDISPAGTQSVTHGDIITLTITPDTGYHISQILVDGVNRSISTELTLTVTTDHTVEVLFRPDDFTVTSSVINDGSGDPHGSIIIFPDTTKVSEGESLLFTFTPEANYHLAELIIDDTPLDATGLTEYTLYNIRADHTLAARFAKDLYSITAAATSTGGQITIPDNGLVAHGETLTATITAYPGYSIIDILVDGQPTGQATSYTFANVTANHTIGAILAPASFSFTLVNDGLGNVLFSGGDSVTYGSNQIVTITPPAGYLLIDVKVDGVSVGPVTQYTFHDVTASHTVEPIFAQNPAATNGLNLVKPATYVATTPSTYPLLNNSGSEWLCQVTGGSGTYDWFIFDHKNNIVNFQYATDNSFTITVDDLFAQGAGVYRVTVEDSNDAEAAVQSMYVRIPMRLSPMFGNHKDTDGSVDFTVTGADGSFVWSMTDENGEILSSPSFGSMLGSATASNTLTLNQGLDETAIFLVQARIDDPDLAAAGLDTVASYPHIITPVPQFIVLVKNGQDATPISGVTITAVHDHSYSATSDADGQATILDLPNTGTSYSFTAEKNNYLTKTFIATDLNAEAIISLEPVADVLLVSGTVSPAGPSTRIKVIQDGTYLTDSDNTDIMILADEVTGAYTLTLDRTTVGNDPFTVAAIRSGYIFSPAEGEGVVEEASAADNTGKDITLQEVTKITITKELDYPDLTFTITAVPSFNGPQTSPNEILVFAGESQAGNDVTSGLTFNGDNSYSYPVEAPSSGESAAIFVLADTSPDRSADSGYYAEARSEYVAGMTTTPTKITIYKPYTIVPPDEKIVTVQSASKKAEASLPAVGLIEAVDSVSLEINEAAPKTAGIPKVNRSDVFEITLTNNISGTEIKNLNRIYISLDFDPATVGEGSFQSGATVIYHADSMTAMLRGDTAIVPMAQIWPVDYNNGKVTFWVDHLSVFGLGSIGGSSSLAGAAAGGGCFIETATAETDKWSAGWLIGLAGLLALPAFWPKKENNI